MSTALRLALLSFCIYSAMAADDTACATSADCASVKSTEGFEQGDPTYCATTKVCIACAHFADKDEPDAIEGPLACPSQCIPDDSWTTGCPTMCDTSADCGWDKYCATDTKYSSKKGTCQTCFSINYDAPNVDSWTDASCPAKCQSECAPKTADSPPPPPDSWSYNQCMADSDCTFNEYCSISSYDSSKSCSSCSSYSNDGLVADTCPAKCKATLALSAADSVKDANKACNDPEGYKADQQAASDALGVGLLGLIATAMGGENCTNAIQTGDTVFGGSCGFIADEKKGEWCGGVCYAGSAGDCCELNIGVLVGLIIGILFVVVVIPVLGCYFCKCCCFKPKALAPVAGSAGVQMGTPVAR